MITIRDNRSINDRRIEAVVDNKTVCAINNGIGGRWTVAMSQCLPSNIDEASEIVDAFNQLFERYEKIKR